MEKERAVLHGILKEVDELIAQARKDSQELKEVKVQLESLHEQHKVADFEYRIRNEHIRRLSQQQSYCLRRLQRQKTVALQKLREIE